MTLVAVGVIEIMSVQPGSQRRSKGQFYDFKEFFQQVPTSNHGTVEVALSALSTRCSLDLAQYAETSAAALGVGKQDPSRDLHINLRGELLEQRRVSLWRRIYYGCYGIPAQRLARIACRTWHQVDAGRPLRRLLLDAKGRTRR